MQKDLQEQLDGLRRIRPDLYIENTESSKLVSDSRFGLWLQRMQGDVRLALEAVAIERRVEELRARSSDRLKRGALGLALILAWLTAFGFSWTLASAGRWWLVAVCIAACGLSAYLFGRHRELDPGWTEQSILDEQAEARRLSAKLRKLKRENPNIRPLRQAATE